MACSDRRARWWVGAGAMVLLAGLAHAGLVNEVPSCYKANKLEIPQVAPAKEVFVLIDQTTLLDERLQNSVLENAWGYLGLNTAFTIVTFSAFAQGRYTEVVASGVIEPAFPVKERDSTSVRLLNSFDECIKAQVSWARKHAVEAIKKSFAAASSDLARSDILAALKDVSSRVRESAAKEKSLFVVSDMLENSSVTSFYAGSTKVRAIDPVKELAATERAGLFGNFGGARVFVLGAGLIGPAGDTKAAYRDPKTMTALREFWDAYFKRSDATLEQFGQPALLRTIQ